MKSLNAAPSAAAEPAAELAQLLSQLAQEVAQPLTEALERLQAAQRTLDPTGAARLSSVREPVRRARDAVLLASQIGRLAGGRVQAVQERLPLHQAVHQVAEQRRREAQARGLQLRVQLQAAEVSGDPALLQSLLHALLDWTLWHTRSSIEVTLNLTPWPVRSRLECRFAYRDLDQVNHAASRQRLDDLRWRLVKHLAQTQGVDCRREDDAGVCLVWLDFPVHKLEDMAERLTFPEPERDAGLNTQPFAGMKALVVTSDAELHADISELMYPLGWLVDGATGVDEAFQHCLQGLPQVIVVDAGLRGPDLDQWCMHVLAEAPSFCFIEISSADTLPGGLARNSGVKRCQRERLALDLPVLLRHVLAPTPVHGGGIALTLRL